LRLAFVVQRYGLDIAGGAEYHCRLVAEHLARHAEVEVVTTCAHDYISWADHYPEGLERLNGIPVRRFRVKRPRDTHRFADWSERIAREGHTREEELRWLEEEGPFSPRLVRHVARSHGRYDALVFFSYRYYTTYHGLLRAGARSLLVPTAENDGVFRLDIFRELFQRPGAIVWNSVEERELVQEATGNHIVPGDVVGVGSELPATLDPDGFRCRHGLNEPFLLYVGRIDQNKGCPQLFDYFARYRRETGSTLKLVLIGKAVIPLPRDPAVVPLGFQPDAEKWNALAACELLVMPSRYESLSMVTLEAWWAGKPVLANARCEVLRGQCQRSNAGLYYTSYDEFHETLALLEGDAELRRRLGANGRRYYDTHYAWDVIETKYLALLERLPRASAAAAAS
jgi:glycosyltransferase involved in cell wall biosynthesis